MPVRKFRTLDKMTPPEESEPLSGGHLNRIRRLWHRAFVLNQRIYPRGVFKYRSLDEAQIARDRMIDENIDRLLRQTKVGEV